jgi:hypothetical protein
MAKKKPKHGYFDQTSEEIVLQKLLALKAKK